MPSLEDLIKSAQNAAKNAYAPYSNFKVGAAVYSEDRCFSGCNVENVAYPLGQCAEATAIGTMVAAGCSSIDQVVVLSPTDEFCYPCGGCRQKIAEFSNADTLVYMVNASGEVHSLSMDELLPHSFTF